MDTATIIVLFAVLLMVLAYLAQPFVTGGDHSEGPATGPADTIRRRAALLAERNRILTEISALDFDYSASKIADEDYTSQRHALFAQGVAVLKQIDALPPVEDIPTRDPIEAAVLALRSGQGGPVVASQPPAQVRKSKAKGRSRSQSADTTSFCPHCGKPVVQGDLFCSSCGNRL